MVLITIVNGIINQLSYLGGRHLASSTQKWDEIRNLGHIGAQHPDTLVSNFPTSCWRSPQLFLWWYIAHKIPIPSYYIL